MVGPGKDLDQELDNNTISIEHQTIVTDANPYESIPTHAKPMSTHNNLYQPTPTLTLCLFDYI